MDDQGKGSDLVKTALGILLLVAGSFFAIKGYPSIPDVPVFKQLPGSSSADAATVHALSKAVADVSVAIAGGFKQLVTSILLMNAGALMLFWGGSKKS